MDTPILRPVAITSLTDGEYIRDGAHAGVDVIPRTRNSRCLFGVAENGGIYRSLDGVSWQFVLAAPASNLIALHDDGLLRVARIDDVVQVHRSDDDGLTWIEATWADGLTPFRWLTPGAYLVHWGVHEAANGTLVMVEYRLPEGGRHIYRSGDGGRSWSAVFDAGPGLIKHFHAVFKHEGLDRWIVSTGDGIERQCLLTSDDDARTWQFYTQIGDLYVQPVRWVDGGDPVRLVFGSDLSWQVGWLDISDGPTATEVGSLVTNWSHQLSEAYAFEVYREGDVYYACQYDHQASHLDKAPVISVSTDLTNWAVHHQFRNQENGLLSYAGRAGGRMHGVVMDATGVNAFALSPATVRVRPGLVLRRATTNLAPDSNPESAEASGWMNLSAAGPEDPSEHGTLSYCTEFAHSGSGCIRYRRTDGGPMLIHSPSFEFEAGRAYQARLWIRGSATLTIVRWARNGGGVGRHYALGIGSGWREVILPAVVAEPGTGSLRVQVTSGSTLRGDCDVYLDSLQIQEAPSTTWSPPAEPQAESAIRAQFGVGSAWTNTFTLEPDNSARALDGAQPASVKTYTLDADNHLELRFEPADRTFRLGWRRNGVLACEAATQPQRFPERAQLRLAVTLEGQVAQLALANAGPVESVPLTLPGLVPSGSLTITVGDPDGRNVFPATLVNDMLFPAWLSTEELRAALDRTEPVSAPGDVNGDRVSDLVDLMQILASFGLDDQGDADADGDTDVADLLLALASFGVVSP